jgi:HlyD family secretion protein
MTLGAGLLLAAVLGYAFWPTPIMVDLGEAVRAPMVVTIDEEARTRVRDAYVVSAPIAGRLLRVDVEPGDPVEGGETTIARMLPLNPSALDIRTREQALASVKVAEAALRVARADLNKAMADQELAEHDLERSRTLRKSGTVSQAALDQAQREARAAGAALDMAKAAIAMREADLANARARLISFGDGAARVASAPTSDDAIPLAAPVSGRILQVMQRSETTLAAGTPILEIGDIANDLEIVAELLSTDAVQVEAGDRVIIENWGGPYPLGGTVERVEPWGFTKFSALGVEEQRVNTIIRFADPLERRASLGHGFRVETRILIWESEDALTVPSSALFRQSSGGEEGGGGGWAVFSVAGGQAHLTPVEVGRNNGVQAQILSGLASGDTIVLYPGPGLTDGARVKRRKLG